MALRDQGVLTADQASGLLAKLALQGNSGDAGKVGAFLNNVNSLRLDGFLTQAQADALSGPGSTLLASVTIR